MKDRKGKTIKKAARLLAGALFLFLLGRGSALAAHPLQLPGVTAEMGDAAFWLADDDGAEAVLADYAAIQALNRQNLTKPECCMNDLKNAAMTYDGAALNQALLKSAIAETEGYIKAGYYMDIVGNPVTEEFFAPILLNMTSPNASAEQTARYGIVVNRTDLRGFPTRLLMTDEVTDIDFDYFQLGSLRVNEPVLVRLISADGHFYYCDSLTYSGWVFADDVALCASREEWLSAWDLPPEDVLVVTGGRVYLEYSNTQPRFSGKMLTMGTVLRQAQPEEYGDMIANRSPYQNYVVWMPVRRYDGTYSRELTLIPQNSDVRNGYLPLTPENLVQCAYKVLGNAYGWGGMLKSQDCSTFVRDVYRCFGLELPLNVTWQSAMPVRKYNMAGKTDAEKMQVLDALPPGALLNFDNNAHTMMYLGKYAGQYYVINSLGSIRHPERDGRLRVRSIVINTLSAERLDGSTWLSRLGMMVIPWESAE